MSVLLALIIGISFIAIFVYLVKAIFKAIDKDRPAMKVKLKRAGISTIAFFVAFILFTIVIANEDVSESETATEEVEEAEQEPVKEESPEEKAAREQKEAEEKALAEQKAKEEAEAAAKAAEEARIAEEKAAVEKKANAQSIEYGQLKKNPDRYAGEYVKYTGEILQILEGNGITNIRLSVSKSSYGYNSNDVIFIEYDGYTDFVDEDIITVYGEIYGSYSYESQAGYNITLPGLIAESFE